MARVIIRVRIWVEIIEASVKGLIHKWVRVWYSFGIAFSFGLGSSFGLGLG